LLITTRAIYMLIWLNFLKHIFPNTCPKIQTQQIHVPPRTRAINIIPEMQITLESGIWLSRCAPIIASHTPSNQVYIYIRDTCSQGIRVCTFVGLTTSAHVKLWVQCLSIKYTETLVILNWLSFRKEPNFHF